MAVGFFMPAPAFGVEKDPFFSNVSLLVGADTAVVDESSFGRTLTSGSGASSSSGEFKFGGGSLRFDGASANSYVSMAGAAELNPAAGDFTFEAWVWFAAKPTGGSGHIIFGGTGNNGHFALTTQSNGNNLVWVRQGIAAQITYVWNPVINTWYHVAVSRQGTIGRMFVDGVQVGSAAISTNYPQAATNYLGIYGGSMAERFNGYMDEVRLTKGVARYTGGFAVPDRPFPRS